MNAKAAKEVVKETTTKFSEDDAMTLGAALAYYAIFSIGPLLVILIGVAGLVLSDEAARKELMQQIQGVVPPKTADMINSMMTAQHHSGGLIATIVGIVVLLLTASGVFGQLKTSLNRIWRVKTKPGRSILALILGRVVSILIVFGIGVLLLASMLLTSFISGFYGTISRVIHLPHFVLQLINLAVSLGIITVLFAIIFKFLPDVRVRWRGVWIGAFATAVLFLLGEYLLSLYLGAQTTASAYGAAGSVVLLLMWIYYSSLILFAGAEFTHVYARQTGSPIEPRKYAELLDAPAQEKRGSGPNAKS